MTDSPRTDLERLATIAGQQGKASVAAVCRAALGYIRDLEGELQRVKGNAKQSALTRAARLTPAQRTIIAKAAARQRWHKDACGVAPPM